jgi:hypothetical protein
MFSIALLDSRNPLRGDSGDHSCTKSEASKPLHRQQFASL